MAHLDDDAHAAVDAHRDAVGAHAGSAGVAGDARTDGDPALAGRIATLLGRRHPVAATAVVTPDGPTTASVGAPLDADYEIGSISKGVTGLLYADALARGEITPTTTLGELLPLGPSPAAGLTLASVSTHRSGLPSLPAAAQPWRRTLALWRDGTNPYGETVPELIAQVRDVRLGKPVPRYANLGFELLGHAVAAAAGAPYADLVRTRIAEPLGIATLYAPAAAADLRPTAVTGRSPRGRAREPWTGEALAPAGGLRASVTDMARLVAALLDRSAPGLAALDPVADFGRRVRIGAAWITLEHKGSAITWHNGGTGGFRSWLGVDREKGTGAVVLSATSASVDRHGFALLAGTDSGRG